MTKIWVNISWIIFPFNFIRKMRLSACVREQSKANRAFEIIETTENEIGEAKITVSTCKHMKESVNGRDRQTETETETQRENAQKSANKPQMTES